MLKIPKPVSSKLVVCRKNTYCKRCPMYSPERHSCKWPYRTSVNYIKLKAYEEIVCEPDS